MNKPEAYQIDTFSSTVKSEVKRLQSQVHLFWDKEILIFIKTGLSNGMEVLECGCGPGFLIEKMATMFPSSHFTGVEIEPHFVKIFRDRLLENGMSNVKVLQGSIMETGLAESSFDFVFNRLVLEHLSEPRAALREMIRVLKPGGKIIITSNDFDFHLRAYPDIPELDELYDAYCRARISEGGNPRIGRELPYLLKAEGFYDVQLDMICAHSRISGDEIFLKAESVGISTQLVKDGFLKSEILDAIVSKWSGVLKADGHAFVRPLFVATGRKPLPDEARKDILMVKTKKKQKVTLSLNEVVASGPESRTVLITRYLIDTITDFLELDLNISNQLDNLEESGFDSLAAVALQERLESDLNVRIAIADFFEDLSVKGICKVIIDEITRNGYRPDASPESIGPDSETVQKDGSKRSWEEGEI